MADPEEGSVIAKMTTTARYNDTTKVDDKELYDALFHNLVELKPLPEQFGGPKTETPVPETPVPETLLPETPATETPATETPVPETLLPETPAYPPGHPYQEVWTIVTTEKKHLLCDVNDTHDVPLNSGL